MKKVIIGYTTGVFDMFHIGHLNILKRSKSLCDYLVVGVSTDEVVEQYKHHRPIIPFAQRVEIVRSIRYVDKVVAQTTMDKMVALRELKFDVMFHGDEWKNTALFQKYEEEFTSKGAKIIYLPHTDGISSTMLRQLIKDN